MSVYLLMIFMSATVLAVAAKVAKVREDRRPNTPEEDEEINFWDQLKQDI